MTSPSAKGHLNCGQCSKEKRCCDPSCVHASFVFHHVYPTYLHFFSLDQLHQMEKCFLKADLDCDGHLNSLEVKYWMEKHHHPISQPELRCIMNIADLDKDGRLSFCEFVGLCVKIGFKDFCLSCPVKLKVSLPPVAQVSRPTATTFNCCDESHGMEQVAEQMQTYIRQCEKRISDKVWFFERKISEEQKQQKSYHSERKTDEYNQRLSEMYGSTKDCTCPSCHCHSQQGCHCSHCQQQSSSCRKPRSKSRSRSHSRKRHEESDNIDHVNESVETESVPKEEPPEEGEVLPQVVATNSVLNDEALGNENINISTSDDNHEIETNVKETEQSSIPKSCKHRRSRSRRSRAHRIATLNPNAPEFYPKDFKRSLLMQEDDDGYEADTDTYSCSSSSSTNIGPPPCYAPPPPPVLPRFEPPVPEILMASMPSDATINSEMSSSVDESFLPQNLYVAGANNPVGSVSSDEDTEMSCSISQMKYNPI